MTWTPADPQSWSLTEQSLRADGKIGAQFLVFANFWLNTAEKMMTEPTEQVARGNLSPANAIRQALEVTERTLGFIDVHYMGQLLVVIGTYWIHGDAAMRELSPIELKLAGEAMARKLNEMQREDEGSSAEVAEPAPMEAGADLGGEPVDDIDDVEDFLVGGPDPQPNGTGE